MKQNKVKNSRHGFTLVEVIVTLALYFLVMTFVMGILLPAVKFSARFSDKEGDAAFLTFVQETLTEKILYAKTIMIYDYLDSSVTDDFEKPSNSVYYIDRKNEKNKYKLFKKKVVVNWDANGDGEIDENDVIYVSAPRKPEKGTDFIIHISKLGYWEDGSFYGNTHDVTVHLILERNGKIVGESEFSVRALNTSAVFSADDIGEGMQAIYID